MVTIGDIRVRFATSKAARAAYEQQRNQHNNRDTQAERLLTYTGQVSPVFIPSGHHSEASRDATLHKLHISSAAFRGLDSGSLLQLFKDSLKDIYENIISLDTADTQIPDDFFTALFEAAEKSAEDQVVELDSLVYLYLFEFSKITKTGGGQQPLRHH